MRALRFGDDAVTVIDGLLYFAYAENPGIAFGQLQEGGEFGRWMLAALAALAAVGCSLYFFRTPRTDDRMLGACALLLAGIAGNLTDRVRLGHVIDFIEVTSARSSGRPSTSPTPPSASARRCSRST